MRTIKSIKTLELERDTPSYQSDPFEKILEPKAIVERSRRFMTVSDAVPELSVIARKAGKDLNIVKDFQHCVRILDMNKL